MRTAFAALESMPRNQRMNTPVERNLAGFCENKNPLHLPSRSPMLCCQPSGRPKTEERPVQRGPDSQ